MIGTSFWSYVFIRSCIFFLHSVAPASIVYVLIVSLVRPSSVRVPWILEAWAVLEVLFYFLVFLPLRLRLQRAAVHPERISREGRRALFRRCHDSIPDMERYLVRWFMDAPVSEIRRENVKEFFRWAFLNASEADPADDDELNEYVDEVDKRLGWSLPPGRGKAKCLRMTVEKVDMLHRSLLWYVCVLVVDLIASSRLHYYRFHFHRTPLWTSRPVFPFRPLGVFTPHRSAAKTLSYWHRPHTSKTRLPILFVHGIGIGLYPYVNFLSEINMEDDLSESDGELGIIAVEIMSISFRLTSEALQKDEMCREILAIVQAHGWDKFVLVSHSYGSVVAAHLLHTPHIANMISSVVFIDPVSFLLHLPDVAYNFTWRKPVRANEHQLSYFAAKDMGVSHTLSRRFFWSENILWKEDLQDRHVTILLGGRDLIIDPNAVAAYLTDGDRDPDSWEGGTWMRDGLRVIWSQDLDHAQVFDKRSSRRKLVGIIRGYCRSLVACP